MAAQESEEDLARTVMHTGATWATVGLRLDHAAARAVQSQRAWLEGPLPIPFSAEEPNRVSDAATRGSYFPGEIVATLYGAGSSVDWSRRYHRSEAVELEPHQHLRVIVVGLELHTSVVASLEVHVLVLHLAVVPKAAGDVASKHDMDLAVLGGLLVPQRYRGKPLPPGIDAAIGLGADELLHALATTQTWFTMLRTVDDASAEHMTLRGAATGTSPADRATYDDRVERLQKGRRFDPSVTWSCEVAIRGVGFIRRLPRRYVDETFFDTAAPAYVRTIYFDMLHLVSLQNLFLGLVRAEVSKTQLPTVGESASRYQSASTFQRTAALFRIRLWWTNIGRGGWQEELFRRLQDDWDVRARLEDLEAEASALADFVETVSVQNEQLQRESSRRVSSIFSVLLGSVALLAVPQLLLAAYAVDNVLAPDWMPSREALAQVSIYTALFGLALLPTALLLALYWALRGWRLKRSLSGQRSR